MSSTPQVLAVGPPLSVKAPWRPPGHRHLHGSDFTWAIAFVVPYVAVVLNIVVYIWKWMPFWTVIFLAARMKIPQDIYDSAEIDGATGARAFIHVTFPLMANLYFLCTLLSTLWAVGDFTTVYLVSGGGPGG